MKIIYFCCPKSTLMKAILLSVVCLYLAACGGTTKDKILSTTSFTDNEFTKAFPVLNLKYQVSDSMLRNTAGEKPLAVAGKNYFPDSLVTAFFGKDAKPKFYPLGKAMNPGKELYVVMHGTDGDRHAAFLLCYDSKLNYKDGLLLCATDSDPKSYSSASIDKSFGIVTRKETYQAGEGLKVSDHTLMLGSEGVFIDILNNDPEQKQLMVNPLDTMSAKGKFAGDYISGEQNFISIRDGRDSGEILLFYHFEKGEGCNKEIKDYARINSKNTAIFRKDGDPCVFTLTFTGTQVTLKEDQGCGNYRGLNCTLNGTFAKKKKPGAAGDTLKKKAVVPVKKTK